MYKIYSNPFLFIRYWIKIKLIKLFLYFKYNVLEKQIINKTKKLHNSKKGKKVFVFANGPSLQKISPHKIQKYKKNGYDLIAINSYISSIFSQYINPDYYVLADPGYFSDYNSNPKHFTSERIMGIQNDIQKIKNINSVLFIPIQYYENIQHDKKLAFINFRDPFSSNVSLITKPPGYTTMTAYIALSIACYLGYSEIYIAGFDNSWFKSIEIDVNNEMYLSNNHFYDNKSNIEKVSREDGENLGHFLFINHFLFKDLHKFNNFPIINLDPQSLTDAFSKKHNLDVYEDSI
jgi:hypothetical protein